MAAENTATLPLGDSGLAVTQGMTTPSRPGKKPRPVWSVSGNTYGYEEHMLNLGGRKYRGSWSFFSDPSAGLLQAIEQRGRLGFAEQQEAKQNRASDRAERFKVYAEHAAKRSETAYQGVKTIMDSIPLGQPILVDHYSARRHRRELGRIDSGIGKAVEESKKAEHWTNRAASAAASAEEVTDIGFMGRRLAEVETELRACQRNATRYPGNDAHYAPRIAELQDKIAYWQTKIENADATQFSRENVKVGDFIERSRNNHGGGWFVAKLNPKTITALRLFRGEGRAYRITAPYLEIKTVMTPKEGSEAAKTARDVYGFKGAYPVD